MRPEVPQPVPEVPRLKLWLTLLAPPLATILAAFATSSGGPGFVILGPLLILAGLVHATTVFSTVAGRRYRGTSLAFLVVSYFLGQVIVCLMFWAGVCLLNLGGP